MAGLTVYLAKKPSRYPPLAREVATLTDHAVVRVTTDGGTPWLHSWVPFIEMDEITGLGGYTGVGKTGLHHPWQRRVRV